MPRGFITNQSCPSSWRKVLSLMFVPSLSWQMTRFVNQKPLGEKKRKRVFLLGGHRADEQ
eukprot:COSAG06_NODE_1116_length_10641_cov_138.587270_1_plen_60_part_00